VGVKIALFLFRAVYIIFNINVHLQLNMTDYYMQMLI
jgi:hypothetical protein